MLDKIRTIRRWLFLKPWRVAVAGFLGCTLGYWLLQLLISPEKFLADPRKDIADSAFAGVCLGLALYVIHKFNLR